MDSQRSLKTGSHAVGVDFSFSANRALAPVDDMTALENGGRRLYHIASLRIKAGEACPTIWGGLFPLTARCCMNASKKAAKNRGIYGKFLWRFAAGYDTFELKEGPLERRARFPGSRNGQAEERGMPPCAG